MKQRILDKINSAMAKMFVESKNLQLFENYDLTHEEKLKVADEFLSNMSLYYYDFSDKPVYKRQFKMNNAIHFILDNSDKVSLSEKEMDYVFSDVALNYSELWSDTNFYNQNALMLLFQNSSKIPLNSFHIDTFLCCNNEQFTEKNYAGYTPLMLFFQNYNSEKITLNQKQFDYLLNKSDLSQQDKYGCNALMCYMRYAFEQKIKLNADILFKNPDLQTQQDKYGNNALILYFKSNKSRNLNQLLSKKQQDILIFNEKAILQQDNTGNNAFMTFINKSRYDYQDLMNDKDRFNSFLDLCDKSGVLKQFNIHGENYLDIMLNQDKGFNLDFYFRQHKNIKLNIEADDIFNSNHFKNNNLSDEQKYQLYFLTQEQPSVMKKLNISEGGFKSYILTEQEKLKNKLKKAQHKTLSNINDDILFINVSQPKAKNVFSPF